MALSIPTITLNDGRAMPLLGLGTYKSTEKEAEKAIVTAAKYGYRLSRLNGSLGSFGLFLNGGIRLQVFTTICCPISL